MKRSVLLGLLVVTLLSGWPASQAYGRDVDPTGRFGLGLAVYSGWEPLASRGLLEAESAYNYDATSLYSRPLGLRRYTIRYYASPNLDMEYGVSFYHLEVSDYGYPYGSSSVSFTDIPLSFGVFRRSSLGDEAHVRSGGRLNLDIATASVDIPGGGDSNTEVTFGLESVFGVEWFVTDHFSFSPEVMLGVEFPNDNTNGGITSWYTGFGFTVLAIP